MPTLPDITGLRFPFCARRKLPATPLLILNGYNTLWNNKAFVQSNTAQIVSEANLRTTYRVYSGNTYCAAPIVEPELAALVADDDLSRYIL